MTTGTVYRSNNGHGKVFASLVSVTADGNVLLRIMSRRGETISVPEWFFVSPACGWKEVQVQS